MDTKLINSLLKLERRIAGVKLTKTKAEFDAYAAKNCVAPIPYCVAVRSAMLGYSLKFTSDNSGCWGSTRALGLKPPKPEFYNGESGYGLGLFATREVAAATAKNLPICQSDTYGVVVMPLEKFQSVPDVVLLTGTSRQCMRLLQGYSYFYGAYDKFCISGNQAVCEECTVFPLTTGRPNISLLCSGTRYSAKWNDEEVMAGIPGEIFENVVNGVLHTVNGVEPDDRKTEIIAELNELGYSTEEIVLGDAYYLR